MNQSKTITTMPNTLKKSAKIKIAIIVTALLICLTALILAMQDKTSQIKSSNLETANTTNIPSTKQAIKKAEQKKHHKEKWEIINIQPGDTISNILVAKKINYTQINKILADAKAKKYLTNLQPKHQLSIQTKEGVLTKLKYNINQMQSLHINREENTYSASIKKSKLTKKAIAKTGTITTSMSASAKEIKIPANIYMQFVDIFSGTIDFKHSTHPGDKFSILYNEYYIKNKKVKSGKILAASFTHNNKTITAVEFTQNNKRSYYHPDGKAMEPLYLKYPVKFTRISSPFSMHRMDPIRHVVAPHLGVDLAAPTGTPIKSIGDGTVIFSGWSRGFGRTVIITYGKHMRALYAHMDHFSKNLPRHVKKGQLIGYVGQTGWATGPHLHFGIYIDGTAVDPLKMKIPSDTPIPESLMAKFNDEKNNKLNQLQGAS